MCAGVSCHLAWRRWANSSGSSMVTCIMVSSRVDGPCYQSSLSCPVRQPALGCQRVDDGPLCRAGEHFPATPPWMILVRDCSDGLCYDNMRCDTRLALEL